jgi:hypothetical protein
MKVANWLSIFHIAYKAGFDDWIWIQLILEILVEWETLWVDNILLKKKKIESMGMIESMSMGFLWIMELL